MTRLLRASIAVVSALAVVSVAVKAQEPEQKKRVLSKSNQVYVKIILPIDPATRGNDQPAVESWIAEQLKKRGQSKFSAATAWVPITVEKFKSTDLWDGGNMGDKQSTYYCPVRGEIRERKDGRIKVLVDGWSPAYAAVTVSLKDEPGSREIAAVERIRTEQGLPYVAVLIGPPPEKPVAQAEQKK